VRGLLGEEFDAHAQRGPCRLVPSDTARPRELVELVKELMVDCEEEALAALAS
jgi:hypothetical protein